MKLVFDIETDGLYEDVTRCWLICAKDIITGNRYAFWDDLEGRDVGDVGCNHSGQIRDGITFLLGAKQLIGHNIIGYDIPVLKKLFGWEPSEGTQITDTLVLSRLFMPDRPGGHGLGPWGERLGFSKGDYSDWTGGLTEEMIKYCIRDVDVNCKVYDALKSEIKGQQWGESIDLEHKVAAIMSKQEIDGVKFDEQLARQTVQLLTDTMDRVDQQLSYKLPVKVQAVGTPVLKPFKKDGTITARAEKLSEKAVDVVGPFQAITFSTVDLGSDKQVKEWLTSIGWKPTERTATGGPKLTADSFDSFGDAEIAELLPQRINSRHRRSQIQGWLDNLRTDGRITASANTIGTPTGRMRHRGVVNVPSVHAFMGQEMRSMFCAGEGNSFVGHDASGLELRMLAHYMNDPEYTEVLLNGDIHSHNQELAGLHTRSAAKTFIYAFIYGAGNAKLGSIVEGGEDEGAALRSKFLRENPKLNKLINRAKRAARERGYLRGLDGRRIWLRRDDSNRVMEHKALNTLLQCAGAVVMKKSMIILNDSASAEGLVFRKVIDMHDEGQAEVWTPHSTRYAELAEDSVVQAGIHFNLNVPLAAEAKIGNNWAETH